MPDVHWLLPSAKCHKVLDTSTEREPGQSHQHHEMEQRVCLITSNNILLIYNNKSERAELSLGYNWLKVLTLPSKLKRICISAQCHLS